MSRPRKYQPYNHLPLKTGKLNGLLDAVGMTALDLMRTGVGINRLGYARIGISTLLVLVAWWLGNLSWLPLGLGHMGPQDNSLLYFALLYPAVALYQRRNRNAEIESGALPEGFHPDSIGRGRLDFLPFEERFNAFFDPIVVLLFSALLVFRLHVATLLGLWGMLAAMAFFALQVKAYQHGEAEFRGSLGSIASANARADVLSHVEQARADTQRGPHETTGTIATGMDDLLMSEIARRGENNL
jgi:hypothetical protein